jgi:fatty acid desaturase
MIRQEIRDLDVGKKKVRSFGYPVGGVLIALALVGLWRNGWRFTPAAYALLGAGGVLAALALAAPAVLRPVYRVWMGLALVLGFVMTRVILTLVFFLVITPVGWIMRVLGKDPLHRRFDRSAASYWIEKTPPDPSPKRLEKYY